MLEGSHVKWFIDGEVAAKIVEFGNQVCIKCPKDLIYLYPIGNSFRGIVDPSHFESVS